MNKNLIIVDDHPLVAIGLKTLFSKAGWSILAECQNADLAESAILKLKPKVVVTDVMMPGRCILETCRELKKAGHSFKLIFISAFFSNYNLLRVMELKADGIICKADNPESIVNGLNEVYTGNQFLSKSLLIRLEHCSVGNMKAQLGVENLTKREKEILKYIALGYSPREIGNTLNVAATTVETHRTNLMRKLNLHTQVALVRYAIREGVILP